MYQVLHDDTNNNVTDSGCHWHCVGADHSSRDQGCWQCGFKFRTVHCCWALPGIWDKSSDIKIGQWGRPWLVWYVPCKRRCVPRFTKLKHRHRHHKWHNDRCWRQWRRVSPVKKLTRQSDSQSELSQCQWQSVGEPHDAISTVSDELSLESPIKSWQLNVLLQSLASIPQIYQSIFQINRPERKTVYSEPWHVLRGEKCPDASRIALKCRVI